MRLSNCRGRDVLGGAAILLAALIALPSCTADDPACPVYGVGAVEGYLLEAGQGIAASVSARAIEGSSEGSLVAATMADSSGWYRLELPTGRYRLEAGPSTGGLHFSNDPRDTITVTPRVHRLDLRRGRALIEIAMPAALDGETFALGFEGRDDIHLTETVMHGGIVFDARLVRPGRYLLRLTYWDANGRITLPGSTDPTAGDSLTVGSDTVARLELDLAASYASLSGSVTGSWQQAGIFPPWVEAVAEDGRPAYGNRCDDDGTFTLHLLLPEPVRLRTRIDDVAQWVGGDAFETARVFDLAPGDRVTSVAVVESGIEVVLQGPGEVLYHQPDLTLRSDTGALYTRAIYTATAGPVLVCNLPPGRYYLHVDGRCNDQIWAPAWYDGVEDPEDATPIDLAEGELRTIVVSLVEGGRIAGDLLTYAGDRPGRTQCLLFLSEEEAVCPNPPGLEQGRFDFHGLPNGQYYLAARLGSHDFWWYPGTWHFAEASPIVIADLQAVSGLVWHLPAIEEEVRP